MSELGSLSECMMDSDAAAKTRAGKLRRKALAASVILQVVVIAGVMLWPLVTLGVLPAQVTVTPLPPFRGEPQPQPASHQAPHLTSGRTMVVRLDLPPPRFPSHSGGSSNPEPPGIGATITSGDPGIPGGFSDGQRIEIVPPSQAQNKPLKMSEGVMNAQLERRVEPEYPRIATYMHLAGTVLLRATIGTYGEVHSFVVVSGNPILAQAACDAVRQWRYRPTLLSGQPVEVETEITVNFVLN